MYRLRALLRASDAGRSANRGSALTCVWNAINADVRDSDDCHLKMKTLSAGIMKLRLLTAQLGVEVMSMEWSELDLDTGWWTIPGEKPRMAYLTGYT